MVLILAETFLKALDSVSGPGTVVLSGSAVAVLLYLAKILRGWDQKLVEIETKLDHHLQASVPREKQHEALMTQVAVLMDRLEKLPERVSSLESRMTVLETKIETRLEMIEKRLEAMS